jgi:hypothetical protein
MNNTQKIVSLLIEKWNKKELNTSNFRNILFSLNPYSSKLEQTWYVHSILNMFKEYENGVHKEVFSLTSSNSLIYFFEEHEKRSNNE